MFAAYTHDWRLGGFFDCKKGQCHVICSRVSVEGGDVGKALLCINCSEGEFCLGGWDF